MSIQQLIDLREKHHGFQSAWYRQILTISSGGFAILVGLGPDVPTGIGRYFLAGTWFFLGLGILSGGAATYQEVSRAKNLAQSFQEELLKTLAGQGNQPMSAPIVASPHRFFLWAQSLMVVSLLMAVTCLVVYSIVTTLGP